MRRPWFAILLLAAVHGCAKAPDAAVPQPDASVVAAIAAPVPDATPAPTPDAAAPMPDGAALSGDDAAPTGDTGGKSFVAPAETVAATIQWFCANEGRPHHELNDDERAFRERRMAYLRDAITRPADRAAMLDAFDACAPAPESDPEETWETRLQTFKYALAFSADGKTFVKGTVDCDRDTLWDEHITRSAIGPKAKGVALSRARADDLAPPLALAGLRFIGLHGTLDLDHVAYQRIGALSFLTTNRCEKHAGVEETEITQDFDCARRVEVRTKGGPVGLFLQSKDESPEWEAERVELYARANVPAVGLATVRGGDHGCGSFALSSHAVPADIASAVNTHALVELQAGRLAEARTGFEAALAIDPAATLARYNLACALALLELPAESVAALAPLVAKDATDRKSWLAKVRKDKDFDKIRASAELQALLSSP